MNGFSLKMVMTGLMLLDHLYQFFPEVFPVWFFWTGRLAAPVFFFLAVEGVMRTRSRKDYLARLVIAGCVTWAGVAVIARRLAVPLPPNNIFFSLAASAGMAWAMAEHREHPERRELLATAVVCAAAALWTEAGFYGVFMTLVFVLCRNNRPALSAAYVTASLVMTTLPFWQDLSVTYLIFDNPQWMMIFALPFLLTYNGKRGPSGRFAKWFFYAFYPAHLMLLFWLAGSGTPG